jgi:hypothetical protein
MPQTLDNEEQTANHRRFLLQLMPQAGQFLAHQFGGYAVPSHDVQAAELKAALKAAVTQSNSGVAEVVAETSWWMAQFMDQQHRMSREEFNYHSDQLASYAFATVHSLIDRGILAYAKDVEIPELQLPTELSTDEKTAWQQLEEAFNMEDYERE